MKGRKIKTLIKHEKSSGNKSIRWNAASYRNEPIYAELYVYKIKTNWLLNAVSLLSI